MGAASNITKLPKLFLGSAGLSGDILILADELRSDGYEVETAGSAFGSSAATEAINDFIESVEVAFLVVSKADKEAALRSISREVGLLQGRLGLDRVVLLVEDGVDELSADSGIRRIRYPEGRLASVKPDVLRAIRAAVPVESSLRVPISEQAKSADLRIPWIFVGIILLLTLFSLAMLALTGGPNSNSEPDDSQANGETATSVQVIAGPTVVRSNGLAADATSIPVVCSIDLRKDRVLGEVIGCGRGELVIEGFKGPWHNEIHSVAVSPGVVTRIQMENQVTGADNPPLVLGQEFSVIFLNSEESDYGTDSILAEFTTTGQHIHIYQSDIRGGQQATLVFRTL